jgi:hypothetical protein
MSPQGKNSIHLTAKLERSGAISPSPAEHFHLAMTHPHDGIVHGANNGAIMHQEQICHRAKLVARLGLLQAHGLLGQVAAGADQGSAKVSEEKNVEGSVGKENSQPGIPRGNRGGQEILRGACPKQQDDWCFGTPECLLCAVGQNTETMGPGQIRDHHGEGLGRAMLALPEACHRHLVSSIDQELHPPKPLQGQDFPSTKGRHGLPQTGGIVSLGLPLQRKMGATDRTCHRLGMKAAVARISVLLGAKGTQRETRHGGLGTIIGKPSHNGPTGATVGAVEEGIAMTRISGVSQLSGAVLTECQISREHRARPGRGRTGYDFKADRSLRLGKQVLHGQ